MVLANWLSVHCRRHRAVGWPMSLRTTCGRKIVRGQPHGRSTMVDHLVEKVVDQMIGWSTPRRPDQSTKWSVDFGRQMSTSTTSPKKQTFYSATVIPNNPKAGRPILQPVQGTRSSSNPDNITTP